jgi:hypothetical protein
MRIWRTAMGSYRISVRRDVTRDEFNVMIHDETERSLAAIGALSATHARKVARDLKSLIRKADPDGAFTIDVHERRAIQ